MRILRLFFYSLILLIIATIGLGYFILLNSEMLNPREPQVNMVLVRPTANFTPLPPTNAPITPNVRPNQATFIDLMADLNAVRQSINAPTLTLNAKLNAAAATQALYTSQLGRLTHDGANGDRVQNRVEAQGYLWRSVAENLLSRWDIDGHKVFKQWQDSPDHNENMMNPKYTEIGLAYMITSEGEVFYAMVLARPR